MKQTWIFVFILGIAILAPGSAESDLWRINSPMGFTSGPELNMNYFKIWTINSSTQIDPALGPGGDEVVNLPIRTERRINITQGTDAGIHLATGADGGINRTGFICNIV